jgi:uncharacterized protein (DUF1330 family)
MNAYLILDLTIHDLENFRQYIQQIPAFIQRHGGRYLVQGEPPTVMEGDWQPQRVVVIEFPARQDAQAFLQDPDAQSLFALRHNTTTSNLILVGGCS